MPRTGTCGALRAHLLLGALLIFRYCREVAANGPTCGEPYGKHLAGPRSALLEPGMGLGLAALASPCRSADGCHAGVRQDAGVIASSTTDNADAPATAVRRLSLKARVLVGVGARSSCWRASSASSTTH
jgi:hypothetical protein